MWLTQRRADAWDLVQDTLLRALDHGLERLPPEKVCNWLFVVMGHLHIDHRRRAKRCLVVALDEATLPSHAPAEGGEEPLWQRLAYEDVRQCLAGLDPRVREAYVLHEEEGLSLADTARRLSVPIATAGTRVHRARRRLRALLSQPVPPAPS
jgi:RNA polymerase sigma-70 factor (ECF subfamily)